jgi:hypothetical protein
MPHVGSCSSGPVISSTGLNSGVFLMSIWNRAPRVGRSPSANRAVLWSAPTATGPKRGSRWTFGCPEASRPVSHEGARYRPTSARQAPSASDPGGNAPHSALIPTPPMSRVEASPGLPQPEDGVPNRVGARDTEGAGLDPGQRRDLIAAGVVVVVQKMEDGRARLDPRHGAHGPLRLDSHRRGHAGERLVERGEDAPGFERRVDQPLIRREEFASFGHQQRPSSAQLRFHERMVRGLIPGLPSSGTGGQIRD